VTYPVQLTTLRGRRALVVGGGAVAAQRVEGLLAAGANVHVVALDDRILTEHLERVDHAEPGHVRLETRAFEDTDVLGAAVVLAATDDRETNRRIADAARRHGILVNAADDPSACDFFLPSVIRRGPATITVGTSGRSPLLAARLRRLIAALLPASIAAVADFFALVRRRGLTGLARRDRVLAALADPGVATLVERGEEDAAFERVQRIAAKPEEDFAPGTVAIVGAGPGSHELLTRRALDRLHRADVVLHDKLVTEEVLAEILPGTRVIDVGRRASTASPFPQALTERMMIAEARANRRVVRLHAGDAFVFGRGGEELEALQHAAVPYEIVPGVSAVLAAPATAGVPLTRRGVACGFTVRTGHLASGPSDGRLDPNEETVVVLMGLNNLRAVTAGLVREGRHASTPAVAVSRASRPDQRVVSGTLETLADAVEAAGLETPATLIVGEVTRSSTATLAAEEAA
jgi:uroporphyrin-III C-methyltransferase/precorrin-2 dehydrogenase/sirohydrochlorin ferrochelatase